MLWLYIQQNDYFLTNTARAASIVVMMKAYLILLRLGCYGYH